MEQNIPVNVNKLAIKCKSKKELYDVMLNDCDILLPLIQYANAPYMRGVLSGKILVGIFFNWFEVQHISKTDTKLI